MPRADPRHPEALLLTSRRACVLAFATAFVTLSAQVLVHRMVSAKLVNNLAFLVLSLTMLGFAFSGVVLTRWQARVRAAGNDFLFGSAALFGLTLLAVTVVFYHAPVGQNAPVDASARAAFLLSLLYCLPPALLYAIPFAFCGILLGFLLASPDLDARRVYFFDLAGSAFGAGAVVAAISHVGVETSVVLAGAILLAAAWATIPPRGTTARVLGGLCAAVCAVALVAPGRAFEMRYPPGSSLARTQIPGSGYVLERIVWDPVARIEVSTIVPPAPEHSPWPALMGSNRSFLARFKRLITQNNNAFTFAVEYDGRRESLQGIEETIYAAAYEATSVPRPRALVIGVGGGFDVLTALSYDASSVTGVEVNGATLDILRGPYREYFGPWVRDPRVHLVHGEGRHFLASTDDSYDIVQLSGVDSASGTAGAAHVFSENYLYTEEAFDVYLSRLREDGIINMMRLEYSPPREMLRALATAVGSLRRAGVTRPADHVVMLTARNRMFCALLVKKMPFRPEEVLRLAAWSGNNPYFGISAAPGMRIEPENVYQAFLGLGDARRERAFIHLYPFDVRPVGDDRPFFFKYSHWSHLFPSVPAIDSSVPVLEYSLLVLLALTSLATLAAVYLPLRHTSGSASAGPGTWRFGVYFAGIALGYLGIEMAFLQKFGLFLGHPNYALSVVLSALLLVTGLGSLSSARVMARLREPRFVGYIVALVVLLEYGVAFPHLPGLIGLPFTARVAIVFALVMPVGFGLGLYFPTGLERVKAVRPELAPWSWGLNGMFSVVAPILSVALSTTWGINALLLSAVVVYLAVGWTLPPLDRRMT